MYLNDADAAFSQPQPAQPSLGEVWDAGFELAMEETFVGSYARNEALAEMEKGGAKVLSPEEANKMYPNVDVPWDRPVNELAAYHLNEQGLRRKQLREAIEQGPTGSGVVNFAASAVAHAMDPVETGLGFALGMGLSQVGGALARSAAPRAVRQAGLALTGRGSVAGAVAKEFGENFAGNLAAEAYVVQTADQAQMDYGWGDAALNSAIGGVFGGAMGGLSKYGVRRAFGKALGKSDNVTGAVVTGTRGALENGKVPDTSLPARTYDEVAYGAPRTTPDMGPNRVEYKYAPLTAEQVGQVDLYAPTRVAGSLDQGTKEFGDFFGDGLTLTDSPHVANNIAGHPMDDLKTSVAQVRLENAKILDLDTPAGVIDDVTRARLPAELQEILGTAGTLKEAVDIMRARIDDGSLGDEAFEAMNQAIRAEGFDGYRLAGGTDENPFNQIHVFNESLPKLREQGIRKADLGAVPEVNQSRISAESQRISRQESDLFHDSEAQAEWDNFTPQQAQEIEAVRAQTEEFMATLDKMDQQGMLDADQRKELEFFKEQKKFLDRVPEAAMDFANCLLTGVA